jgi:protein SCO1
MDSRKVFIVATSIAAIVTGAWLSWHMLRPVPVPQTATVLPMPAVLAEFSLLDQRGDPFTGDSLQGEWSLLFFGFTHCPDICPLTLQVLADARRQLQAAGQEPLPRIILVSVDPERDSPEIIGRYVASFGDGTLGVTGDLTELRKLTASLGIFFEKSVIGGDDYSVDHSAVVIVINPAGRFHALFGSPHDAAKIAHDLPLIMAAH